jgi:hypothetical protein
MLFLDWSHRTRLSLILVGLLSVLFSNSVAAQLGASFLAKSEFVRTHARNAEAAINAQSSVGWGADQAKRFFPGYLEAKMRGNVEGVGFFYGLLGSNLEKQGINLFRLPDSEFKGRLNQIMERLEEDNPTVALAFANAMLADIDVGVYDFWSAVQIVGLSILLILLIRRFYKSLASGVSAYARSAAQAFLKINPLSLATIAVGVLVLGFFLAEGFFAPLGILGSIRTMKISLGVIDVPYRWVVIACLFILFYAIWRMLRQYQSRAHTNAK